MECFLSLFLMLNSSLIKNLLHKPAEIQWNITKTLPGKLKRKISWSFFYKILPPEIPKMCKIANVELHGFLRFYEFLKVSVSIFWLKTVLTLNYVFSLILSIFQRVSSGKTFYVQITIVPGDNDAKKTQKNLPQTSHKFFSQCFITNFSLTWTFMVQTFCKNSFSGDKSRKKSIPVIKIIFSLQEISQNYRFSRVKAKTIKYTCRFNTS